MHRSRENSLVETRIDADGTPPTPDVVSGVLALPGAVLGVIYGRVAPPLTAFSPLSTAAMSSGVPCSRIWYCPK